MIVQEAKLVPPSSTLFPDQDASERANFGCSVTISKASPSRVVVVGAPSGTVTSIGDRRGAAYSYSLPYEQFGWGVRQRLAPRGSSKDGGASVRNCGLSVALASSGQELIVGCPAYSSLEAGDSTGFQAEVLSFVDVTVRSTDTPVLIRCTASLLVIFVCLMSVICLGLCGAMYVRGKRESLSSYIRLTAHRGSESEAEDDGIALLGTTMTKSSHLDNSSALNDHAPHRRVFGGASSGNGNSARTHGRLEVMEARNGRLLDFRLRDYVMDFLLCSAGGMCAGV